MNEPEFSRRLVCQFSPAIVIFDAEVRRSNLLRYDDDWTETGE